MYAISYAPVEVKAVYPTWLVYFTRQLTDAGLPHRSAFKVWWSYIIQTRIIRPEHHQFLLLLQFQNWSSHVCFDLCGHVTNFSLSIGQLTKNRRVKWSRRAHTLQFSSFVFKIFKQDRKLFPKHARPEKLRKFCANGEIFDTRVRA